MNRTTQSLCFCSRALDVNNMAFLSPTSLSNYNAIYLFSKSFMYDTVPPATPYDAQRKFFLLSELSHV